MSEDDVSILERIEFQWMLSSTHTGALEDLRDSIKRHVLGKRRTIEVTEPDAILYLRYIYRWVREIGVDMVDDLKEYRTIQFLYRQYGGDVEDIDIKDALKLLKLEITAPSFNTIQFVSKMAGNNLRVAYLYDTVTP